METYTTVSGDTFDKIARNQLGSEYLLPFLLEENQQYRHVLIFTGGITLTIPEVETDDYENVPEWMTDELDESDSTEEQAEVFASGEDS